MLSTVIIKRVVFNNTWRGLSAMEVYRATHLFKGPLKVHEGLDL